MGLWKRFAVVGIFMICAVVCAVGISAASVTASGECGENLTWTLYDDGELVIDGEGEMTDWTSSSAVPWNSHRNSIKTVAFGDSVTTIGNLAFAGCDSVETSVTIGDSVTTIGERAFMYCTSLASVTIPDSVTSIGECAFMCCTSLASVTIPDSVTSIGYCAFYECTSLTSVAIGDSVTSMGDYAFYECTSLTSVTIPDSVTSIGYCAFYECTSLTSVAIGDSVTSIGENAFYKCTSLTSVVIGDSVTSIGENAFYKCTSLTSVVIGDSVTSIGDGAFSVCTSLPSVTIPDSVTFIGDWAFSHCASLTSMTIPDSVTSIGEYVFAYCTSLTSVTVLSKTAEFDSVWDDNMFAHTPSNLTLYGYAGSTTETYAYENGKSFIRLDVVGVLTIAINNTGRSYFVGDKITIYAYRTVENSDGTSYRVKPKKFAVQVSNSDLLDYKRSYEYDDYIECEFRAKKAGTVVVSIADSLQTIPINITLTIGEDAYKSLRADNVIEYRYDNWIVEDDYYNAYVNGMFVSDFEYTSHSDGSMNCSFNVYNETYAPGVVEVYDAGGSLDEIKTIEKFSNPSSLKEAVIGGRDMVVEAFKGDSLSFRGVSQSKCTPISVTVPAGGHITITNSLSASPACFMINLLDCFFTCGSLIDSAASIDSKTFDAVVEGLEAELFTRKEALDMLREFQESFLIEHGLDVLKEEAYTVYSLVFKNMDLFFNSVHIDFSKIMENAIPGGACDVLQLFVEKGGGWAGLALQGIFVATDLLDLSLQIKTMGENMKTTLGWGIFTPRLQSTTMTEIASSSGISVSSETGFSSETILQTFKVVDYSNEVTNALRITEEESKILYDISLMAGGEEAQPEEKVTVIIPVPEGFNSLTISVYRKDENGNWDHIPSTVRGGMIEIELDHFCLFAITDINQVAGDINGNQSVDINDALALFQNSMLPEVYPSDYRGSMDFTDDGLVDINDAQRLFQYSMLPDVYPIG